MFIEHLLYPGIPFLERQLLHSLTIIPGVLLLLSLVYR